MSFTKRRIDLTFQLGEGNFGESGSNVVTVSGLRVAASIHNTGGIGMSEASIKVYGMKLDLMNRLSILGKYLTEARRNVITITAGDDVSGMSQCFQGILTEAWADLNSSPQVSFICVAQAGLLGAMKPAAPTSYRGSADVAVVLSGIAAQMGVTFENSGVSVQLANVYKSGTLRDQAIALARDADINILCDSQILAIWPKAGKRNGLVPLISAETGMVGYPVTTQNGLQVQTIFNPSIVFGSNVQIKSIITPAVGEWTIFNLTHDLESEMPGGKWFTNLECSLLGKPLPIAAANG